MKITSTNLAVAKSLTSKAPEKNNPSESKASTTDQPLQKSSPKTNTPPIQDASTKDLYKVNLAVREPRIKDAVLTPDENVSKKESRELLEKLQKFSKDAIDFLPLTNSFLGSFSAQQLQELSRAGYHFQSDKLSQVLDFEQFLKPFDLSNLEELAPIRPNAPRFRGALSSQYQGKGIGVAVIDTGIYPHPDLTNGGNRIVGYHDLYGEGGLPQDPNGHGSMISTIIAGDGSSSAGLHEGVAKEADIISIRAIDADGRSRVSKIVEGITYAIENQDRFNIKVINISCGLTSSSKDPKHDPILRAIKRAHEQGIVVVTSAGNRGNKEGALTSPGGDPNLITVGASSDNNTPTNPYDDYICSFSSRGEGERMPDLVAPGVQVYGALSPNSKLRNDIKKSLQDKDALLKLLATTYQDLPHMPDEEFLQAGITPKELEFLRNNPDQFYGFVHHKHRQLENNAFDDHQFYVTHPGTSFSSAIISGAVAKLFSANPNLSPSQVKEILKDTANPIIGANKNSQGAGRLDLEKALYTALSLVDKDNSNTP